MIIESPNEGRATDLIIMLRTPSKIRIRLSPDALVHSPGAVDLSTEEPTARAGVKGPDGQLLDLAALSLSAWGIPATLLAAGENMY